MIVDPSVRELKQSHESGSERVRHQTIRSRKHTVLGRKEGGRHDFPWLLQVAKNQMNKSSGIVTRISPYVQFRKFTKTLSESAVSHSRGHPHNLVLSSIIQRRAVVMPREQSKSPSPDRDFPSYDISC